MKLYIYSYAFSNIFEDQIMFDISNLHNKPASVLWVWTPLNLMTMPNYTCWFITSQWRRLKPSIQSSSCYVTNDFKKRGDSNVEVAKTTNTEDCTSSWKHRKTCYKHRKQHVRNCTTNSTYRVCQTTFHSLINTLY